MDYKTLSEMLYKVVKHPSQWNIQDVKRAGKMKKILEREIEKELSTIGLVAEVPGIVNTQTHDEEFIKVEPQQPVSFMERVFAEQDATLDADIISRPVAVSTQPTKPVNRINSVVLVQGEGRYFVTVICSSIIRKPAFQIFKGDNITEKDFVSDQVTRTNAVFYAVVDGAESDIRTAVSECFLDSFIPSMVLHETDWVPPQYKNVWQNKTKIK